MCSIAGVIHGTGVEKMIEAQRHRGPDDAGFYKDRDIELGMGRLSIIDLVSPGLAPYQEDEFILCYNGEIYNYIELRAELIHLGWAFRTTSDTEVLMKAWRQWGVRMFDKLNGMFAFAIYDKKQKKLLLARDIAGEKPLYYFHKNNTFVFVSEAKALHGVVPLVHRTDRFFEAFQHVHVDTLWEGVKMLPPAHYLLYDLNNDTFSITEYWNFVPRTIDRSTAYEELEALLEDSVRIRTRSDVPYGLYYSRGVDSSLISLLHEFSEKFYFDNSLDWKDDFFESLDKVVHHLDFPVGSLSSYPLWKLASWAKEKVTVVLSGEGADEIFGGYVRYLPIAREWEMRSRFPSYNSHLFGKYFRYFSYLDAYTALTARNDDLEFVRETLKPYFEKFEDPITAMGFADFKLIMPSLLQMGDRMASAHSLENRCPFLDRRIIDFGFSLPPDMKIDGLTQKIMLRKILEKRGDLGPLLDEKRGLTVSFNKWFGEADWDRSRYFSLLKEKWRGRYHP